MEPRPSCAAVLRPRASSTLPAAPGCSCCTSPRRPPSPWSGTSSPTCPWRAVRARQRGPGTLVLLQGAAGCLAACHASSVGCLLMPCCERCNAVSRALARTPGTPPDALQPRAAWIPPSPPRHRGRGVGGRPWWRHRRLHRARAGRGRRRRRRRPLQGGVLPPCRASRLHLPGRPLRGLPGGAPGPGRERLRRVEGREAAPLAEPHARLGGPEAHLWRGRRAQVQCGLAVDLS